MIFHVKFSKKCYLTLFLTVLFIKPVCGQMFVYHFCLHGYWYCLRFLFGFSLICNGEYSHYIFKSRLIVRYVALYDRIERQWHVFVQKCKRFIGENINKHFPWKMPGRCPGTSFFKNYVPCATEGQHCLYSCQNILFRIVDYFIFYFTASMS